MQSNEILVKEISILAVVCIEESIMELTTPFSEISTLQPDFETTSPVLNDDTTINIDLSSTANQIAESTTDQSNDQSTSSIDETTTIITSTRAQSTDLQSSTPFQDMETTINTNPPAATIISPESTVMDQSTVEITTDVTTLQTENPPDMSTSQEPILSSTPVINNMLETTIVSQDGTTSDTRIPSTSDVTTQPEMQPVLIGGEPWEVHDANEMGFDSGEQAVTDENVIQGTFEIFYTPK